MTSLDILFISPAWCTLCSTQIRRPTVSRYVHVFQEDGVLVLSVDVSTSSDAEHSGTTLNIATSYEFSTSGMYYLLMDSGVLWVVVAVNGWVG